MKPLVECCSLTKKFGEFYALNNLSVSIGRGEIIGYSARTEAEKLL